MPTASPSISSSGAGVQEIHVSIAPEAARTDPGGSLNFTALVTGSADTAVTWSLQEGSAAGQIDGAGLYTAPAVSGSYHVVASSHAAPAVTAAATVTVNAVAGCSNLPAAGTWEDITPTPARGIDGTVYDTQALMLDPFDPQTLWLGTALPNPAPADARAGLFKSTDCGATWVHVNTGQNGPALDGSGLWSMAIDPVTQGVLYTVAAYGSLGLFKSTNSGVDWQQLFPEGSEFATHVEYDFAGAVVMDPTNHQHLVVTSHGSCSAPYGANGSGCQAETLDSGGTWTIVSNPAGLGFQENAGAYVIGNDNWLYSAPTESTYRSTDHGASWSVVGPGAEAGESAHRPFLPAPDGAYYLPSDSGVLVSHDQGASWSLIPNTPGGYGFAIGGGHLYICPEFSLNYQTAALSDPSSWSALPNPPAHGEGHGSAFMDYDEAHHLLFTSNFDGGLFRMVTP